MKFGKDASHMCRGTLTGLGFLVATAITPFRVQAQTPSICDPTELRAALCDAAAGSVVQIGNCAVSGSFRVPAGVTLQGGGTTVSSITVLPNAFGVVLGTPPK